MLGGVIVRLRFRRSGRWLQVTRRRAAHRILGHVRELGAELAHHLLRLRAEPGQRIRQPSLGQLGLHQLQDRLVEEGITRAKAHHQADQRPPRALLDKDGRAKLHVSAGKSVSARRALKGWHKRCPHRLARREPHSRPAHLLNAPGRRVLHPRHGAMEHRHLPRPR
jgi:hypothetical protein